MGEEDKEDSEEGGGALIFHGQVLFRLSLDLKLFVCGAYESWRFFLVGVKRGDG